MRKQMFQLLGVITILSMVLSAAAMMPQPGAANARSVSDLSLFKASKFDAHYRVPNEGSIQNLLSEAQIPLKGATKGQMDAAVQDFMKEWTQRNPDTPNPAKLQKLLNRDLLTGQSRGMAQAAAEAEEPQIMSLIVPVEFPNSDTFDWCGQQVSTSGPLHDQIDPPGPKDNNTVWYENATPEMYNELYFGVGPTAGVIVHHPNLGDVDLRGSTMANYYLEQSNGKFQPKGEVYTKWLQAAHSEGWYGADGCSGGSHNVRAQDLVKEVVDGVNADDPNFAWQNYDGDGDGMVDNFTVIHAGQGQEAGGGVQGDFSIWSHASFVGWPDGLLVCKAGSAGCPDRDIHVGSYSMDPENIDVGVISEEFGHAAFGLPDIYVTDGQLAVSNWAIMESGSWNGPLGGMMPAPFPLWFRYVIGWADPVELNYNDKASLTQVGQLSKTPQGMPQGIRINLPPQENTVPNPMGTGPAWWSNKGDLIENTLTRSFDLTGAASPIFSFATYWNIEEDWDYAFVDISTDGGATWALIKDMDGMMTDTSPNGQNQGWGLTGNGEGNIRFDLSPYAGKQIVLRLRYWTDMATSGMGWWADDLTLKDGATTLFSDSVDTVPNGWTASGWTTVPFTQTFPRYYLVEWRNNQGFDQGLKYPYATVYSDESQWQVDRGAYTVPGMLVYLRNTMYDFDYTLGDSLYDPPSYGPKHALSLVDSHFFPYTWDTYKYASGANLRLNSRLQPADAAFTLQSTTPFTIRLGYDPATGAYLDEPIQTKTFGPRPAISQFHDSLGYYPGLLYSKGGLYFWDWQSSMVLPTKGNYTTKITDLNNNPFLALYGYDMGDTVLGSGNPGDAGMQYGLHLAIAKQAKDGVWGAIAVWNSPALLKLDIQASNGLMNRNGKIVYTVKVNNLTPMPQNFVLDVPIPQNTTYLLGKEYDAKTNSIHWAASLTPGATRVIQFTVTVNPEVPSGTLIEAKATLKDDALGGAASVQTMVK